MVTVEILPSVPGGVSADVEGSGEPERQLGRISCTTDDGRITLWTDMLALHDDCIQVVSIMGAESAAKGIAAILHSDGKAAFRIDAESVPYYQEFDKEKDGYSSSALPLLTRWTKWDHARSKWAYVPTGASVSLPLSSTLPPWSRR